MSSISRPVVGMQSGKVLDHPLLFSEALLGTYGNMDWKETPEAHTFELDLPGLGKDEVKLQLHNNRVLHISTSPAHDIRKDPDEEIKKDDAAAAAKIRWHCKERTTVGTFSRQFRLPEDALVDQIKASMHDGVLVITVPKDHHHQSKRKHHRPGHKSVEIAGNGESTSSSSSPPPPPTSKGLGRFLCCKV